MKRAATAIAETLGMDSADMPEYRYQKYTAPAVYAIGDWYLAAHPTRPRHPVGGDWVPHPDQFGARGTNMRIWLCKALGE